MSTLAAAAPAPLFSPTFAINPEPTLAWLRESDPLHRLAPGVVVLTRYADSRAALTEPGMSAAGGQAQRQERSGADTSMLNTDGADHHRLRRPGQALMGPAAVAATLPELQQSISALIREVSTLDRADLANQISEPISSLALAHILGLDGGPNADRLSEHFAAVSVALDPMLSADAAAQGRKAVATFEEWLDEHLQHHPNGRLATLVTDQVSRDDVLSIANLAAVGGWSPLAELITTALELALHNPVTRADATGPGARQWCEDVIRWHTPIPFVARHTSRDVSLPSGVLSEGTQVLIHVGSANRDHDALDDPGAVMADRAHPRRHLALGAGAHFCLGAPLVRAVLPLVLRTFFEEAPDARSRGTLFAWRPGIFPRRPLSTTVSFR